MSSNGNTAETSTVETIETNKIKLTLNISPELFKKGLQHAYNRNKGHISIQGFRKGKAPRKIIERFYGKDIFYEEALNHVLPDAYEEAVEKHDLEPVYKPEIDVESMDEEEGAVLTAEVFTKPEVKIENYYGLTYPIVETEPTEEDIQNRLQDEREKNARTVTVERPAEMGDIITINFAGYIDDEPFEGGEASDYELTLGSKTFIDTYEEQLVGHSAGDDVDVRVTFPDDYGKEDLQGKEALFKVEVLEVQSKELPELDDEFAQDVSEFETMAEFRENLVGVLREQKEQHALTSKRSEIVKQLVEMSEMEIPDVMYTARVEEMTEELRYRLWQQGLRLDQYLGFSQMSMDDLHDNYRMPAKEEVEARLVLETISKKENLEVSDEELREFIQKIALPSQDVDKILEELTEDRRESIITDILNQKALDFVVEKAVAIEAL